MKLIKKAKYWIILSIIFTYALTFIGGFVRVTDSGLGCPDWPKCLDRWYPPLKSSDVPEDFAKYYSNYNCVDGEDCDEFNIVKAWTEYLNRLFGVTTGIVITIMFFYLFRLRTDCKLAFYLGGGAFFLTIVEGLIGKYVVSSHLEGSLITIHLLMALIIISLLIMSYSVTLYKSINIKSSYTPSQINIINWIFIFMIAGIILGTQIRESLENFIPLSVMGPFKYIHSFVGIGILMLTGVLWNKINDDELIINTKNQVKWLLNIFIVQIGLGYFMVFGGLPIYAKLLHMWLASISIGIIVYILMDIKLSKVE